MKFLLRQSAKVLTVLTSVISYNLLQIGLHSLVIQSIITVAILNVTTTVQEGKEVTTERNLCQTKQLHPHKYSRLTSESPKQTISSG